MQLVVHAEVSHIDKRHNNSPANLAIPGGAEFGDGLFEGFG